MPISRSGGVKRTEQGYSGSLGGATQNFITVREVFIYLGMYFRSDAFAKSGLKTITQPGMLVIFIYARIKLIISIPILREVFNQTFLVRR